jgi:hypothetical protein
VSVISGEDQFPVKMLFLSIASDLNNPPGQPPGTKTKPGLIPVGLIDMLCVILILLKGDSK